LPAYSPGKKTSRSAGVRFLAGAAGPNKFSGLNLYFIIAAELFWFPENALAVFVGRKPFRQHACEINGDPAMVSLKSESLKLGEACPHPPFFSWRINREPDALLARHVSRPRQTHLAGVV